MQFKKNTKLLINIILALIAIGFIVFLNYQVIESWFGGDGPSNIGSIEVSYVSMARFITDFGFSTWNPLWYFGFPTHLFYTPLLPVLEVVVHKLSGMPLWGTYRMLTGFAYILGPVSLFLLGWQLSKRVIGGLLAACIFSIGPTVFYYLVPGVLGDRFSIDFMDPRRFTILVRWGEGPHTFSLIFVPLVALFFHKFIETKELRWLLTTSLFLGLAGLTNAIGLFAGIIFIAVMTFVAIAHTPKSKSQILGFALFSGILTFCFIAFWYNLSFITNFFGEGGGTGKMYLDLFPWGWVGGILGVVLIYFLIQKVIKDLAIASTMFISLIFFMVVYVYYATESIELLPQALRYNVETDLAISLVLGILLAKLVTFIEKKIKLHFVIEVVLIVLIILGSMFYVKPFIITSKKAAGTRANIIKTGEYEIANWLKDHVDEDRNERVFLPGNYGFYLNWFTNVSQHRGGLFQASIHPWPDHMHYQMTTGKNPELAKAWLTIANAKYAVITKPGSRELYQEMKHQGRFDSYQVVFENKGDTIIEVPLKRPSLAKPVNLSQMDSLSIPKKADDKEALFKYVEWIENSSSNLTELIKIENSQYKISGEVGDGEGLLVQMTADGGWQAKDNITGKSIPIKTDPLGFMVLYPTVGSVDISLNHSRTWDIWIGYLISLGTVIFIIWYWLIGRRKYPINLKSVHNNKEEDAIE